MLIGRSLIFVHHPRTGGMSVRAYLKQAVPDGYRPADDRGLSDKERTWLMHQGLEVCFKYATRLGTDPFSIPALVCIRNPYSLALSSYLYLAQRWGTQVKDIEVTFVSYLRGLVARTPADVLEQRALARYGPFSRYMTLGGDTVPDTLTIARTESLADDIAAFLRDQVGVKAPQGFPHKNASKHEHFSTYYGEDEEAIVYRLYRNVFDNGLYARYAGLNRDSL